MVSQGIAEFNFLKHDYRSEIMTAPGVARSETEAFIHRVYKKSYHADMKHFMPNLICIRSVNTQRIIAAAGFRIAQQETLFLEQYMDFPLEKAASAVVGKPMCRDNFVEVGNLAGDIKGAGYLVILALADYLTFLGKSWIAFTLTKSMVNAFKSLGLTPIPLIDAQQSRVKKGVDDWGKYYESHPQAMIGDMKSACEKMHQMGLYSSIFFRENYSLLHHIKKVH